MHAHNQSVSVPKIGQGTYQWRVKYPKMYSRSEVDRQTGDYVAAVPAQLASWQPAIPNDLQVQIEDATKQLLQFNKHLLTVFDFAEPPVLPMSAILLRTESASSSQIERLTTTAKQLALFEIDEGERANAKLVSGNVRAMEQAIALADNLNETAILQMHKSLLAADSQNADWAGRYRDEQVWIGGDNAGPLGAEYIPPHKQQIAAAMSDLTVFLQRTDLSALVQAAVAHAQFETIHPFVDGNGRTGRALVHTVLYRRGMLDGVVVPLSAGLLRNTEEYFAALTKFREGDARPILSAFADASLFAASTGMRLIDALAAELSLARAKLSGVRKDALAWSVLPLLIGQPVLNSKFLREQLQASEPAALRALQLLTDCGIVKEISGKSRGRIWQHTGILDALDEFAAGIKRNNLRLGQ